MTSEANWRICKLRGVWGLDYGYYVSWERYISKGDLAIVYVNKLGFCAVIEVGEKFYDERPTGWTKTYPYRFGIAIKKEGGPLRISSSTRRRSVDSEEADHYRPNLIDDIVFVTDRGTGEKGGARWNSFVFPSLVAISADDFNTVEARL